jgi:DNA-directed RNA polymerase alpha subunit
MKLTITINIPDGPTALRAAAEMIEAATEKGFDAEVSIPPQSVPERAEITEQIRAMPISELNLTVRTQNCLTRENINTVGSLLELSVFDLEDIRNLGSKSIYEIRAKLSAMGLALLSDEPFEGDILDQPIKRLSLSRSTSICLRNEVETIGDLIKLSRIDLLDIKWMDDANVREILGKLAAYELTLAPDPEPPTLDGTDPLSTPIKSLRKHRMVPECAVLPETSTLGELVAKSRRELSRFPHLDRKALDDIESALSRLGYALKEDHPYQGVYARPVTALGLPARVANPLTAKGWEFVGDLTAVTPSQLRDLPNISDWSIGQISIALARLNLSLQEDWPKPY